MSYNEYFIYSCHLSALQSVDIVIFRLHVGTACIPRLYSEEGLFGPMEAANGLRI